MNPAKYHETFKCYEYECLPASEVKQILTFFDGTAKVDSYLSEDPTVAELRRLKAAGFRWVRTDGDHAIFERVTRKNRTLQSTPAKPTP